MRGLASANLSADHLIAGQDPANVHLIVMNHNCFNIIILTLKFFGTCIVVYLMYKVSRYAYFKFKRNFHKASIEEEASYKNRIEKRMERLKRQLEEESKNNNFIGSQKTCLFFML